MPKKLSISKALNRIRRIRVLTVVSSLAVVIALSQMILSSGVKSSKAATQTNSYDSRTDTYIISLNGDNQGYIPAVAEDKKVIIMGPGTIYADAAKVRTDNYQNCGDDSDNANCDTKRHFKSLVVQDGAIITHASVTVAEMSEADTNESLANATTGTGRWHKVDFEITSGDFTLKSNAKIDVSGKGYPGGLTGVSLDWIDARPDFHWDGYGPGGAVGYNGASSSGGYGGSGGNVGGVCYTTNNAAINCAGGNIYGDSQVSGFEFGSGGSAAASTGHEYIAGSAGGGRVRINSTGGSINVDDGSYIYANGAAGQVKSGAGWSGAGSGGSIILTYKNESNYNTYSYYKTSAARGGVTVQQEKMGSDGTIDFAEATGIVKDQETNIFALGGDAATTTVATSGGGGRIYIAANPKPSVTVTKKLTPLKRNGVDNTSFDPYSLQIGDVVQVELTFGSFTDTISVTEEMLEVSGGSVCKYLDDTASPDDPNDVSTDKKSATWSLNSSYSNSGKTLTYQCMVENP